MNINYIEALKDRTPPEPDYREWWAIGLYSVLVAAFALGTFLAVQEALVDPGYWLSVTAAVVGTLIWLGCLRGEFRKPRRTKTLPLSNPK